MKLFHLSQTVNQDYDTYDSCVVAAEDEAKARAMMPDDRPNILNADGWRVCVWCAPEHVVVRYIGEAADGTEQSVVCASFNAG